jgi:hypothetical protein
MVLPPGSYVFKLFDSQVDRSIVQVFNEDQTHLFATILAVPDTHLRPTDKTVIMFEEREAGAPQAIRAWFYPDEKYGADFVYPQPRAATLAQTVNQPVPSMPANTAESEMKQVTVTPQQPRAEEAPPQQQAALPPPMPQAQEQPAAPQPQEQAALPPPPQPEPMPQAQEQPAAMQPPQQLPKTASDLPLMGLLGLLSLSLAGALRLVRKSAV